jgi:DNA-binding NarL/FixJ family response regulator
VVAFERGDHDDARRLCSTATDLYTENHLPFEAAQARLGLAAALEAAGRDDAASAERERAREALAALGAATRRRSNGPLTPRELEVLRLVGDGLSDGEIAERLVLSEHTVHRHVANVRTKLGVSSRAAAAAKAARTGLL